MSRRLVQGLPNVVSLSRLGLGVAFVLADAPLTRALLVVAAAATDALDGWLARLTKTTTPAGALIDPLADRVFAILAVAALLFDGTLTTLQYFLLLLRDIATMGGFLLARMVPRLRRVAFRSRPIGKVVTVLQFFSLFVALAHPSWASTFIWLAGAAAVVAVGDYVVSLTRGASSAVIAAIIALAAAAPASAQRVAPPPLRPEWRLEAAAPARLEVGGGLSLPAGRYVRIAPMVALGPAWRGGTAGLGGRVEVTGRFTLDPFDQVRWTPYGAGGVALACPPGAPCAPRLVARIGVEGPPSGGWRLAAEAGVGDGAHLTIGWRRAVLGAR